MSRLFSLNFYILFILLFYTMNLYSQKIEQKYISSEPKVTEPADKTVKDIDEPAEPHMGSAQIDTLEVPEPVNVDIEDPQKYLGEFYDDHLLAEEPPEVNLRDSYIGDGCPVGVYCADEYENLIIEPPYVPGEMYTPQPVSACPPNIKCN